MGNRIKRDRDARALKKNGWLFQDLPFAFSPISTRRRIASERETSLAAAQASRLATVAGSSRAGIVSL